ncbi:tetratricopeptide repeat protein [Luteimonas deserti]|uniref:Tetratricopeptide repeat protein n=1 Tax=Luteimonas deserti TaxID=2752306 RepID=A0A7Z0TZL7_9GAMM|nr:tetratricopeptide repeat protein [Luteimonas deserti]NYZ63562.1 tetratricopeptide repeat protein [Luteimonas deserti]
MTRAARVSALTRAQAYTVIAAQALRQQGRHGEALSLAGMLVNEAPLAADAHQLLGMCLADHGDSPGADIAFARALELAPGSDVIALNVATWWRRRGRIADAVTALAGVPATSRTCLMLGRLQQQSRQWASARASFRRALALEPDLAEAWRGLGQVLHQEGAVEEAIDATRQAAALDPPHAPTWMFLGVVLREAGRLDDSLACLRRAGATGHDEREVADAVHGVLHDAGRMSEALEGAHRLVDRDPAFVAGHETLAHLQWERSSRGDASPDPLARFERAAREQPGHVALHLALVRALLQARRPVQALVWLEPMLAREADNPALLWLTAEALDASGRSSDAYPLYIAAARRYGATRADFLNAHIRHLIRSGRIEHARRIAEQAVSQHPDNQEAWALRGVLWRLEDDPREFWLCDYDRLIGEIEVEWNTPEMPDPLGSLRQVLAGLHLQAGEPMAQSVRNGSQTPGRLFGRNEPVLQAAATALRDAVEQWVARLPADVRHPFLGRKGTGVRFAGSWSVQLVESGRHANHIHDQGWMSSAFYVSVPRTVREASADAASGWIQFGQPLETLGLTLAPRRLIRPQENRLVVFPSYMWHGTVPFNGSEPRLTVAADLLPGSMP